MRMFSKHEFELAFEILSVKRVPLMCFEIRGLDMARAVSQFFLASVDSKAHNVQMN